MEPLPWAATAVPAKPTGRASTTAVAVPSFSTRSPPARSTIAPLPSVVKTSLCLSPTPGAVKAAAPVLPTRCRPSSTSPTVRPLASARKMPPPAARAVRVSTLVSKWLPLAPMPFPARRRREAATMSSRPAVASSLDGVPSASRMLPVFAAMPTRPRATSTSATVTLSAAHRRAVPPAAVLSTGGATRKTLVALCTIEPAVASTSSVPPLAPDRLVRRSDQPSKRTSRAAMMLRLPLPLVMSAWAAMSLSTPCACSSTLPLPCALRAVPLMPLPTAVAVPSFSTMPPARVRSTMEPLAVVKTSLCLSSVLASVTIVAPVLPTRLTLSSTSSTVRSSASSTKMPLAERAVSVPTEVSRWSTVSPMDPAARRRSDAALTSSPVSSLVVVTTSASRMLPPLAVMLTRPSSSSTSPTVTLLKAHSRAVAVEPVLTMRLVASCVIEPAVACTSTLPLVPAVLVVRMSAPAFSSTLREASTVMLPLPLAISALALAVMSLVALVKPACTSTLPVPWALTATPESPSPAAVAVPSFSTMPPAVVRSTIAPLSAVVKTSLCLASLLSAVVVPAALPTRFTLSSTSPTVRSLASSTKIPPPAARAVSVPTVVSRWSTASPMPVPARSLSDAAVTS